MYIYPTDYQQQGAMMLAMLKIIFLSLLITTQVLAVCQTSDPILGHIPQSTPDSRFTVNNADGTVMDKRTKLIWKQAAEDSADNWLAALTAANNSNFAGQTDWRLPNIKELSSIVELQCENPSINEAIFPDTPASDFWSSSFSGSGNQAFFIDFNTGASDIGGRAQLKRFRLVRDSE